DQPRHEPDGTAGLRSGCRDCRDAARNPRPAEVASTHRPPTAATGATAGTTERGTQLETTRGRDIPAACVFGMLAWRLRRASDDRRGMARVPRPAFTTRAPEPPARRP